MQADRPADLVLIHGRIATMDAARSFAEAVAVRDGRIVAVGGDVDVARWVGPPTRLIDLRGRTVTPGFGDAHIHPVTSGVERLRCDLRAAAGPHEYPSLILAYATAHPELPWVEGGGWSLTDFPGGSPTAPTSTGWYRIVRSISTIATATRHGSTPGRSSWPGSTPR